MPGAWGCRVVFVSAMQPMGREVIAALQPELKAIGTVSVGYNHVDLEACREYGVSVFYSPGVLSDACADLAVMLVLNAARRGHEAEALVRGSDVPWSIVRAAPFYYLLARLFHGLRWMPWWWLPDAPMQPVDTADVAARIVECVEQRKPGVLEEIGGPEAQPFPHLAQDYLEARGLRRRVLRFRLSDARARRMGFAATSGHTGSLTWREWLGTHGD